MEQHKSQELIAELMRQTACPCCATKFDRAADIIRKLEEKIYRLEKKLSSSSE